MNFGRAPLRQHCVKTVIAIVRLSRLKFVIGGLLSIALGTVIARYEGHPFGLAACLLALFTVTIFQLMTHYSNDYFDRECDERSVPTAFSGGSGVLPRSELTPIFAARLALATASLGLFATIIIAIQFSITAAALAISSGILSWSYSAPPARLLARGLGELTTALVVAILAPLFGYAMQTGGIDARAVVSTIPAACAMFAMMLCVEIPDIQSDGASGKVNLLVRFGLASARRLIEAFTLAIFVAAAVGVFLRAVPPMFGYFALGAVPVAISLWRTLERPGALAASSHSVQGVAIAARGVLLFAVTVACGALGYAAAIYNKGAV